MIIVKPNKINKAMMIIRSEKKIIIFINKYETREIHNSIK